MNKHLLIRPIIDNENYSTRGESGWRKIWVDHHPENDSRIKTIGNFKLSNPRISGCKEFLDEDIFSLNDSGKNIGISKTAITRKERLWVTNNQNTHQHFNELIKEVVTDKNRPPLFFLFY